MNLRSLLQTRTAGDPDDPDVVFTDLSPTDLSDALDEMGTPAGADVIRQWMDERRLRLRKISNSAPTGATPDRDAQFQRIHELIDEYQEAGEPYFSVDTKAKERLGRLFREGRVRCDEPFESLDHDFPSLAEGVIIPHGIFDPLRNRGHINIGLSHDTSEFACDSLRWYWNRIGKRRYPGASSILLLMDGGGSNNANHSIFKYDLQRLADSIGLPIRVAHYPSYCSKYNPIERRFFCHVTRACTGMMFDSLSRVVELMRKTHTRTGLRTTVNVLCGVYETCRRATAEIKRNLTIAFDHILPQWNYRAIPKTLDSN